MCCGLVVAFGLLAATAAPYTGTMPATMPSPTVARSGAGSTRVAQAQMVEEVAPPQPALEDAMSYGFSSPDDSSTYGGNGCQQCGCSGCVDNGFGPELPCPWRSTCNLFQHVPYYVEPKTYYYFRPYNFTHVWQQRKQVAAWGGDPRHPYSNEIFKQVYRELDSDPADTAPMSPGATPFNDQQGPAIEGQRTSALLAYPTESGPLDQRLVRFLDAALAK